MRGTPLSYSFKSFTWIIYSFPIAPWSSAVIPILQMRKARYITDRMTCPKSHMVNGRAEIVTQINEETGSERLANL